MRNTFLSRLSKFCGMWEGCADHCRFFAPTISPKIFDIRPKTTSNWPLLKCPSFWFFAVSENLIVSTFDIVKYDRPTYKKLFHGVIVAKSTNNYLILQNQLGVLQRVSDTRPMTTSNWPLLKCVPTGKFLLLGKIQLYRLSTLQNTTEVWKIVSRRNCCEVYKYLFNSSKSARCSVEDFRHQTKDNVKLSSAQMSRLVSILFFAVSENPTVSTFDLYDRSVKHCFTA